MSSSRYLWQVEMMLFTWVQYLWAAPRVNQPMLYLILVVSIWLSPPHFVTIRLVAISSSKNLIPSPAHSCRETSWMRGASLKPTICISLIPTKYFPKPPPSWLTAQLSCKGSFGKIMHAFKKWNSEVPPSQLWLSWSSPLSRTNVLTSNSWPYTSLKVLVKTPMVSWASLLTKKWAKRSFITYGHWKTTASLTMLWSASQWHRKTWTKLHMHCLEVTTPHKSSVVPKVSRPSRISLTGSEPGPWKAKAWLTAPSPCRNQEKTPATPLSLILAHHSSPFLQMSLRKLGKSGPLLFLTWIARLIRRSATSRSLARRSSTRSSQ